MPPTFIRAYCERAPAAEAAPGTPIRFVASTENVARDGLIIAADGWQLENFRKNPVFLWAHDYRRPPIGRAVRVDVEGKQLVAEIEFDQADEDARQIEDKYRRGFLSAVSVGWEIQSIDPPKGALGAPRISKAELLEISGVPVPSDPDALKAARSAAERADSEADWPQLAADMVALYLNPTERPVRAWRSAWHTLSRAYEAAGREPPERLSPDYLAALDTEAIAGLFLEGEAELCGELFRTHQAARDAAGPLPGGLREQLRAVRDAIGAVLTAQEPAADPPTAETQPTPEDDDLAALQALRDFMETI